MIEVSSTGGLGYSLRQDERAYINGETAIGTQQVSDFIDRTQQHLWGSGEHPDSVTRMVSRAVIDAEALPKILGSSEQLRESVEAISELPPSLEDDGGPEEYLVYFSRNIGHREQTKDQKEAFKERLKAAQQKPFIPTSLPDVKGEGGATFSLVDSTSAYSELHELWGSVFDWTLEGCKDFAQRVDLQQAMPSGNRDVWFKGVINELTSELVACAMAERLNLPTRTGNLALVEHSEWSTKYGHRGYGLGKIVVRALADDLKSDLSGVRSLVYAECNILSGAHVVALHSGFKIPLVEIGGCKPDQILYNNVRVGDGIGDNGYRTFLFVTAS